MERTFDTLIGILNGVIGDQLANSSSALATNTGFYYSRQGQTSRKLDLDTAIDLQLEAPISNKIVVFLHGLTNTESIWNYPQHSLAEQTPQTENYGNYGSALHTSLGYTPFFVRYNSGLAIEENGRIVSELLSQLVASYPCDCDELVLVGFSMGGLISRLAQSFGEHRDEDWFQLFHHAIYIGTPHEGARLEKFADAASSLLSDLPKDYFSHWADWINIRSTGIKDLKHGLKSTQNQTSTKCAEDRPPAEHFSKNAEHSFISGALSPDSSALLNKFFGDSLVTQNSASPANRPAFSHSAHFDGLHHLELAHSPKVFHQIESWLQHSSTRPLSWQADSLSLDPTDHNTIPEAAHASTSATQHSNAEIAKAAALLVAQTYLKALGTVETIHNAISREPYSVLNRIPPVSLASEPIEQIHLGISNTVFSALRLCGTGATTVLESATKPTQ